MKNKLKLNDTSEYLSMSLAYAFLHLIQLQMCASQFIANNDQDHNPS